MRLKKDLTSHENRHITNVLHRNADLFAWKPSDMLRIHPSIICQKLAICPQAKPISQEKRKMGEERHKSVKEEVVKLLNENFIREVKYST